MPALPMDEAELTRRVSSAVGAEVEAVEPLSGGASSLVYSTRVASSGQELVVKSCPPGVEPIRNRDMLRQAHLHHALAGGELPIPAVVGEDAGAPPEVPPFFVMERLAGECVEVGFAPPGTFPPSWVRGRQLDTVRLMAQLHTIDPESVGLSGEPVVSLEAEVQRWKQALDACDQDQRVHTDDVHERLLASVPAPAPSRVLHGDFRTGNVLAVEDRVTTVIDWEIWSRSDPRIDLAWFLIFVENDTPNPEGTPPVDELLATYEAGVGGEVKDLDWFRALARYKQVAARAIISRNARRRGGPVTSVDNTTSWQLVSARELLG
jgi:aminoglycoside phosphotransferase (APT) family kinase protein